jgi:hypothetical protein
LNQHACQGPIAGSPNVGIDILEDFAGEALLVVSLNRLKTIIAAVLLGLWIPAGSLCLAENAGLLAKNAGCCDDQSSEMSPCCALASATYKMDENAPTKALSLAQIFVSSDSANLDCLRPQFFRVAECGVSPPELSTSWQFSFRAALAPRAPSSAS